MKVEMFRLDHYSTVDFYTLKSDYRLSTSIDDCKSIFERILIMREISRLRN